MSSEGKEHKLLSHILAEAEKKRKRKARNTIAGIIFIIVSIASIIFWAYRANNQLAMENYDLRSSEKKIDTLIVRDSLQILDTIYSDRLVFRDSINYVSVPIVYEPQATNKDVRMIELEEKEMEIEKLKTDLKTRNSNITNLSFQIDSLIAVNRKLNQQIRQLENKNPIIRKPADNLIEGQSLEVAINPNEASTTLNVSKLELKYGVMRNGNFYPLDANIANANALRVCFSFTRNFRITRENSNYFIRIIDRDGRIVPEYAAETNLLDLPNTDQRLNYSLIVSSAALGNRPNCGETPLKTQIRPGAYVVEIYDESGTKLHSDREMIR